MEYTNRKEKICGIIVTYFPISNQLAKLIKSISCQVDEIVIVDNTPEIETKGSCLGEVDFNNVTYIKNNENLGVSLAHNLGLAWARDNGCSFALLLDQDSYPMDGMIKALLHGYHELLKKGIRVAAVGPCFRDERMSESTAFIKFRGFRLIRTKCGKDNEEFIEADYLISSGSLIPIDILDEIGDMNESLFIDYIDIEWGLRAKREGYKIYGICAAKMIHSLSDSIKQYWFFGKREAPVRSPLRHYYLFRNGIYMLKQGWIPIQWKVNEGVRIMIRFLFYIVYTSQRVEHLRKMSYGIWHGFVGEMGENHRLHENKPHTT